MQTITETDTPKRIPLVDYDAGPFLPLLVRRPHLSLEAVGGLGGLRATATKAVLRPRPSDQSETTTFTVVIVGFEAAARLLPHLFAVPMFRIYAFDRHPLQVWSGETPPSPRASTLPFVGVSARIGW